MSSTQSDNYIPIFAITSLFAAEFVKPKIGISGKGFKSACLTKHPDSLDSRSEKACTVDLRYLSTIAPEIAPGIFEYTTKF